MGIAVHIPRDLREYSHSPEEIIVSATSVGAALGELQQKYPSLYVSVCDETGRLRRHINLFINSDMVPIRTDSGLQKPLRSGDILTIWQAVSGG